MKRSCLLILIASVLFSLTGTAVGQLRFGTDFTNSDALWSVTHVQVKSNMIPHYLEGLKETWVTANEVSKELGQIDDWAIYGNILPNSGDYNLTLVVEFRDLAQYDKGRKEFKEFEEAWLKKISQEKREKIVQSYPDIRTIVGEYLVRKIDFK
jgi:hypothetical protein